MVRWQKHFMKAVLAPILVFVVFAMFAVTTAMAAPAEGGAATHRAGNPDTPYIVLAAAFAVGIACLGAAYAVGRVGAAAMGAASERPEIMGRALIFVGLAEGIAIYGLIVGIMLIRLLG